MSGAHRAGDHALYDELAVGWALHALEPEDEAAFSLHLPDCARCARTVAETSDVMAALATDLPPAEPSAELGDRLRAAVQRTEQVRPADEDRPPADDLAPLAEVAADHEPPRQASGFPLYEHGRPGTAPQRSQWRRLLPSALVAAVVAALLALGTWTVVLGDARDRAESTVAEQSEIMQSLLRPGQATIAPLSHEDTVVATVVARDGQLQVVTQGLGMNDTASQIYVVWGMGDGDPVPLGTFDVVRSQMDLRTVGSDRIGLDDYTGYAVSIEPGRHAPATPSEVVATGEVTS
ncbi:anti-sigma factor domain-containing protein [Blastococcus sp. SYSU D00669]